MALSSFFFCLPDGPLLDLMDKRNESYEELDQGKDLGSLVTWLHWDTTRFTEAATFFFSRSP